MTSKIEFNKHGSFTILFGIVVIVAVVYAVVRWICSFDFVSHRIGPEDRAALWIVNLEYRSVAGSRGSRRLYRMYSKSQHPSGATRAFSGVHAVVCWLIG